MAARVRILAGHVRKLSITFRLGLGGGFRRALGVSCTYQTGNMAEKVMMKENLNLLIL